ncbi:ATP-grasp domain-containing protein [Telmatospirillum siberiense]|uniref:ATP-grasp domain-containing protein n=1 Tax=Telmatospirillum siberiense TaxID=382514 RepID=A0A2N3PNX2_9PROT|nr:ATP-grasp domain-containing protein [Telmatospirillum siberiense]PKU22087.1 hypothetical protein CWS72_23520 [Telmatospirillum siberiense]
MGSISNLHLSRIGDLKEALTGSRTATFVWLCNFEVEDAWSKGFTGLPGGGISEANLLVQRMEEQGILIAEPGDYVITGQAIDPEFLSYLDRCGLGLAEQIVVGNTDGKPTNAAVLDSPAVLAELRSLAKCGAYLMPMGVSGVEETIAAATGLRLAGPPSSVCVTVNSKIYSRRLTDRLGLRPIAGRACETVDALRSALLTDPCGPYPLIVKDAYGVSGKGLLVLRSPDAAAGLLRMVERRAERRGSDALHVVVETFLEKRFDLNYQITVSRTGQVTFDFVKRAVTEGGVHKGHVIPAGLTARHYDEIRDAGLRIGAALHGDGFFGVAGVDALLDAEDVVRPVLEINARLNMSTYQTRVLERFSHSQGHAQAQQFNVHVDGASVPFSRILDVFGSLPTVPVDGEGVLVTCFGTVNAFAGRKESYDGRLYVMLFGRSAERLQSLEFKVAQSLSVLSK